MTRGPLSKSSTPTTRLDTKVMTDQLLNVTLMDSVTLPIPPVVRWLEVSHRPPSDDVSEIVLDLVPTDPNAEEAYLRLDLPDRIYREPLNGSASVRPTAPDATINLSTNEVQFADTNAARMVQELIEAFPLPRSLQRFAHHAAMPFDSVLTLLAALTAEDADLDVLPVVVVEGHPVERERALLYSVLWLCNIHHLVREGMEQQEHAD